jgi:hypothetical protein
MADASPYALRLSHAADWRACPAFVRMTNTPQAKVVEAAGDHTVREEGTAMHEAAQWMMLFNNLAAVSAGSVMKNGIVLTDELVDGAAFYVQTLQKLGTGWTIERQMSAHVIHAACGGTPDAYTFRAASAPTIVLADLKGGYRPVEVYPNDQLFGYTACIIGEHPEYDSPDTVVEYHIIQPRAYHRNGPVRTHTMLLRDVYPYIVELRRRAAVAMGDNAQAVAGPQCDNCTGRASCSTAHDAGMRALEIAGEPDVQDLPIEAIDYELQRLEDAKRMIEARLTGLEAQATHMIRNGAQFPSFELGRSAGRLNWIDDECEAAALAMGDLMGLDLRKPTKAITPTQALQRMPKELLERYAQRKPGALKLQRFNGDTVTKAFAHLKKV